MVDLVTLVIRLSQLPPLSAPLKTHKHSLRGMEQKSNERKKKGKKKEGNKQKAMTLRKQYYSNFPVVINFRIIENRQNHSCLTSHFFHTCGQNYIHQVENSAN